MTTPSTVPDTTAWAVDHLRALGWTVVAPNPGVAVPDPAVGQAWTGSTPDGQPRVIVKVGGAPWTAATLVHFVQGSITGELSLTWLEPHRWAAWVRRTNAHPLPTPTDGAAP